MICTLCPRMCGLERNENEGNGFCGMPTGIKIARAALHMWEEPVISGTRGSGTIFFSGCTLRCCFCQNRVISKDGFGKTISEERLKEIMRELVAQGAHNINLVTPTQYTPWILDALQEDFGVPIVYNCGGYERIETLKLYENKIQVYLPDLKYYNSILSEELSGAKDYFEVATKAIEEMYRQVGDAVIEDGLMKNGVIIRHLMIPGQLEDTKQIIDYISTAFRGKKILFSLMSQYTPQEGLTGNLARHVTSSEYNSALQYMYNCGITTGFSQERTSAKEEYTPPFDLTGV